MQQINPYIGRWWKLVEDNRILCYLCPRHCTLSNGQRGFCFVRQNIDNQMVLTTYGRSSGFCINPIEKSRSIIFIPGQAYYPLEQRDAI